MTQRNTPARGITGLILLLTLGLSACGESDSRDSGGSPGQPGTPRELHCAPDPSGLSADDGGGSGIARANAGCGDTSGA